MSDIFSGAKLVVVKVGSALLVDGAKGELRRDWLASLCDDIAALKKQGLAVVVDQLVVPEIGQDRSGGQHRH